MSSHSHSSNTNPTLRVPVAAIVAGAATGLVSVLIGIVGFFLSPLASAVPDLQNRMTKIETKMGGVEGAVQAHADNMTRFGRIEGDIKRIDEKQDLILRLLKK